MRPSGPATMAYGAGEGEGVDEGGGEEVGSTYSAIDSPESTTLPWLGVFVVGMTMLVMPSLTVMLQPVPPLDAPVAVNVPIFTLPSGLESPMFTLETVAMLVQPLAVAVYALRQRCVSLRNGEWHTGCRSE